MFFYLGKYLMLANNNKREFETYINESIKYLELLRDGDIIVAID